MRICNISFAGLALLTTISLTFAQTTYTWFGGAGLWNEPANWSPNGVPGAGDNAIIGAGTVELTSDVQVEDLIFSSGAITGNANLDITGQMSWMKGSMAGNGVTTINPGAALAISGSDQKDLVQRTLRNQGAISWSGTGEFKLRNHAHIQNEAGALFEIYNNVRMDFVLADSGGSFTNAGTLTKSGSGGETQIDPVFINTSSGVVNAHSGILRFERGDTITASAGTFNISAGNQLVLAERTFVFDGASFDGSGTVRIFDKDSDGSRVKVEATGSGITVNAGVNMELDESGAMFKGDGPVIINGTFTLIQGAISGTGGFTVNGSFDLNGSNSKELDGRTLTIAGAMYRTGSGTFNLTNNAVISIQNGATFDIQTNGTLAFVEPLGGSVVNAGAIVKSAGTDAAIALPLYNTGAIIVNSSTLQLTRGGSHSNTTLTVGAGAFLNFNGGVHFLDDVFLTGGGTVQFSKDSINVVGPGMALDAPTTLAIAGGVLAGDGEVIANGAVEWTGGVIDGSGVFTANSTLNIGGTNNKTLKGRTLANAGAAVWSGNKDISFENGAALMNLPGASFDAQTNQALVAVAPLGGTFHNAGTLSKSAGTGISIIGTSFINSGTVNVNSGTIQVTGGSDQTGVIFTIASGAIFEIKKNTHTLKDITLNGNGTLWFNEPVVTLDGTGLTVNSPAIFTVSGTSSLISGSGPVTVWGTFNWSGGTIGPLSAFTIHAAANLSGGTKTLQSMTLNNYGTMILSGTNNLRLGNLAIFSNEAGAVFDFQGDASVSGVAPAGSFVNAGTLSKSGGSGTSSISVALANTGIVNVSSGTLRFSTTSSFSNHSVNLSNGATVFFDQNSATYTLENLVFSGSGVLSINRSLMNIAGAGITVNSGVALLLGGDGASMFGNGPVTIGGSFTWNQGTISGSAPFILNGASTIGSTNKKTLDTRTLTNNGVITWGGTGNIELTNNAKIANQASGSFLIETDASISFVNPLGGTFENAGLAAKQAGAGVSTIGAHFNNTGVLEANSGELRFTRTLVNDTTGLIRGSATLDLSAATFSNYGSFAPGTSPGILTVSGNYTQGDTAALDIELGGIVVGADYDRLVVTGNAHLGGHLNVNFINGFAPQIGNQFEVLFFVSRSGDFSNINLPDIGIGKAFEVSYTSNTLRLSVVAAGSRANLKLWLEGPYSSYGGGIMQSGLSANGLLPLSQPFGGAPWNYSGAESVPEIPDGTVDWVLVELRSDSTASSKVATRAAWLQSDGTVLDIDGLTPLTFDAPHGNYYVVVHHRNHLSIMSAAALPLNEASPLYDFTTAQSQAYGANPMKELAPGVFGMYAGDANADGIIDAADREDVWRGQNGTAWAYGKSGDLNLDGGIDANDLNLFWRPNLGKTTRVPSAPPAPKSGGKSPLVLHPSLNDR